MAGQTKRQNEVREVEAEAAAAEVIAEAESVAEAATAAEPAALHQQRIRPTQVIITF